MKNRINRILLMVFLAGLLVYAALFWSYFQYGGISLDSPGAYLFSLLCRYLLLGGHALPFFALQLLLCRLSEGRSKFLAIQLVAVLLLLLGVFTIAAYSTPGWDALGYMLLAVGTVAPVVGCVLAWVAWGYSRLSRKK